ncbi:MAG: EF-P lysine aminoacylase GenX [Alphaproteobacteria bacterium]|nr:EF-P lysine aminoacylase GenX [Alphaproteobacteria bacterium]MBV9062079.1 EF-P lysine aminoacylase GenX [Alphaproteobacteria bacterium]
MNPWWSSDRHAGRRPVLLERGRIKRRLREWFEAQDFTEVECGALAVSPGNEAHLHAFEMELRTTAGEGRRLYLHTSPEFACKKLLAAGEKKIFDFARVFRNRERGALHAPEFTMLEWYRANASYEAVISDTLRVLHLAAEITVITRMSFKGRECDPRNPAERLTVEDAFARYAGIDLLATLSDRGEGDRDALAREATRADFAIAENDSWADIFSKILVARVEPKLGIGAPTVLYEYPRCEAALARATPHDPRVAERFELYVCGVELANGFGELTDPVEQRRRFEGEMDEKARVYGERYPLDEDFLSALSHMPPASGVALGFDRLVLLATGARTIDDVLWVPSP